MTALNTQTGHRLHQLTLLGLLTITTMLTPSYADLTLTEVGSLANPALDLATNIMGDGITINSATYKGGNSQTALFTNADNGEGLSFGNDIISSFSGGAIFSTGRANTVAGPNSANAGINASGGIVNDFEFNQLAGAITLNATWLEVNFTPELIPNTEIGDTGRITMNIVFGSEEYNSFVYGGVNDVMAIIVNGENKAIVPNGLDYGIDTINDAAAFPPFNGDVANDPNPEHSSVNFESANPALYRNNTDNRFNTQMNGFTVTIPVTFDVAMGQPNTLKIGIADALDFRSDSWLFVKENSGQTVVVAESDELTTPANAPYNIDVLANDYDKQGDPLTIVRINDIPINKGDTITLVTGITVKLEADETLTVSGDGTNPAHDIFTYEMTDGNSGTSVAFVDVTITEPDLIPPVPTISVNNITADNILNLEESKGSVDVTGFVGGEFIEGDTVTLFVNNVNYTGTTDTFGKYGISVPGSELAVDSTIDARVDTHDAAGNAGSANTIHDHTVSLIIPIPLIAVNAITADNVININESKEQIEVTGKVTGDFSSGDTVTLSINGKTYTGSVANTGDSAGLYSITVPGSDLAADLLIDASVTTTDSAGNSGTAAITHEHTLDITLPVPTILINAITADNIINVSESAINIDVAGTVGGDFSSGDTVTLSINSKTYTGSINTTGLYSINVPGSDLAADLLIEARIVTTDSAGNTGFSDTAHSHTLDTTAPVLTLTVNDITADNIINQSESREDINVTGRVAGDFSSGDIITLLVNGKTFKGAVSNAGANEAEGIFSMTVSGSDLAADLLIDASITTTDIAGNTVTVDTTHRHALDITLPVPTLSVNDITADNVINVSESQTEINVTGRVAGDFSTGDTVTLSLNNNQYAGTVDNVGGYSIPVSGSDLAADLLIDASVTTADSAGNTGSVTTLHSHTLDSDLPEVPTVDILVTEVSAPRLTGTAKLDIGDTLTVTVGGATYTIATDTNDDWSIDTATTIPDSGIFAPSVDAVANDVTAIITDTTGNASPDTSSGELIIDNLKASDDVGSLFSKDGGSAVVNVLANDSLEGSAGNSRDLTLTQQGSTHANVTLDTTTGLISVIAGTPKDTYTLDYEVCEIAKPDNCETATVTVTVLADKDGDGIADSLDLDTDNDGIPDALEKLNAQNGGDTDNDGLPDEEDLDADGDGISDLIESGLNSSQIAALDTNGDGVIDAVVGANGLANALETDDSQNALRTGIPVNTDGIGQADYQDLDADNDSLHDLLEGSGLDALVIDVNNDGVVDEIGTDVDRDGIADSIDKDTTQFGGLNTRLADLDSDGQSNYRDLDSDGDGISDLFEASVVDPALADTDHDGVLDSPNLDSDGDGILDSGDTDDVGYGDPQLLLPLDTDQDNHPDYLDLDSDNDSLPDTLEAINQDDNKDGLLDIGGSINLTPPDTDNDGLEDFRDVDSDADFDNDINATEFAVTDTNGDGRADDITDNENDGIPNVIDGEPGLYGTGFDLDNDGIPNSIDLDDDNDGLPDLAEQDANGNDVDTDNDGNVDRLDRDSDSDGISDAIEAVTGTQPVDVNGDGIIDNFVDDNQDGLHDPVDPALKAVDTDSDGAPDFRDLDTDNDTLYDLYEASLGTGSDANTDGLLDSLIDTDRDGLADSVDTQTSGRVSGVAFVNPDTDNDGIYDFRDVDSDSDGLSDVDESGSGFNNPLDENNNNIDDYIEALSANPNISGGALETAVTGVGGSFNAYQLYGMLLLLGLLGLRKYGRHYYQTDRLAFLILTLTASGLMNRASANDCNLNSLGSLESEFKPCIYVGGGVVSSKVDPEEGTNGWGVSDNSSSGYNLFAGYHFRPNWFAELAYTDMGEAGLKNRFDTAAREKLSYKVPSLHLGYLQRTPIQQVSVYGKAGVSIIRNKASSSSVAYEKQTNAQLSFGLGAQWQGVNSPLFARLGADLHDRDATAAHLSVGYKFAARRATPVVADIPAALPNKPKVVTVRAVPALTPKPKPPVDTDGDGFPDNIDYCPLSKRGAPVDNRGCEISLPKLTFSGVLDGVNFHTGSAILTARANDILRNVARQFKRWPDLRVIIVGHTDNVGTDEYNMNLAMQRAKSVTTFLLRHGVKRRSILSSLGRGEREPRANNNSEVGRAMNRRVELLPQ